MYDKPEEPEVPNYYSALGVNSDATDLDIKRAFRKLALKHHPDKHAPGQTIDAVDFRRVHEAYEFLSDLETREDYDFEHPDIKGEWDRYHRDVEDWQRRCAAEAEAEVNYARKKSEAEERERRRRIWEMGIREKARRAAVSRENEIHEREGRQPRRSCFCNGCKERKARRRYERFDGLEMPTEEEYAEYLQMRAEEAERRSREAMRKRREEQEREAYERLRQEQERLRKEQEKADRIKKAEERKRANKAKIKDERSKETARRAREQQERDAQKRMARTHIQIQQEKYMQDKGSEIKGNEEVVVDIGWIKKKGVAKCLFCDGQIKHYYFRCPDGGAIACNPCKNRMCRFMPPKQDAADSEDASEVSDTESDQDEGEIEDGTNIAQEDEHKARATEA